jgi:hypothetical protein
MNHVREGRTRSLEYPGQVMRVQLALLVPVVAVAYAWGGGAAAGAALYGVLIALANTGLLMWRLRRGAGEARGEGAVAPRRLPAGALRSSLERFLLVILLFGLGLGVMALHPLALTLAFVVGQLGWFLAPLLPAM